MMIRIFNKNRIKNNNNRGIATLPAVLVIGTMVLAVVVSLTSVAFNELLTSEGASQSSGALFYAEAGARDAITRIARKKNYAGSYSVDFISSGCANSTDCASVTVSSGLGTTLDPKIITSNGTMKASTRRIQVSVILDSGTTVALNQYGEITGVTWSELVN